MGAAVVCQAATINLGNAGNYAVFGLGSTMAIGSADTATLNTAEIYGDVAVGADTTNSTAIGNGSFQKGFISGSLFVDGGLNLNLFDDEAGQFDAAKVTAVHFVDPTP